MPFTSRARYPPGPVLQDIGELGIDAPAAETVLPVESARVVLADYEVIQHDFPHLRTDAVVAADPELAALPDAARRQAVRHVIDDWLVANAAVVSTSQAQQAVVNSPIAVGGRARTAYRPPRYGRAVVLPVGTDDGLTPAGLLDLKGAGVRPGTEPQPGSYTNGLEYLGVAIGDFLLKRVADEIFRRAGPTFWTVPVYAILDLGFDVRDGMFGTAAAGMHVRRAHRRPRAGMSVPRAGSAEERVKTEIEMLFRNYGLTTTNSWSAIEVSREGDRLLVHVSREAAEGLNEFELGLLRDLLGTRERCIIQRVNVQLADEAVSAPLGGQIVDFGHVSVKPRFDYGVCTAVLDRPLCIGGVLWSESDAWIQPDPRLALPVEAWDRSALNEFSFDLAARFRRGELSADGVGQAVDERLGAIRWLREAP